MVLFGDKAGRFRITISLSLMKYIHEKNEKVAGSRAGSGNGTVIIHDGIRPLVDDSVLTDVIMKCEKYGNAVLLSCAGSGEAL